MTKETSTRSIVIDLLLLLITAGIVVTLFFPLTNVGNIVTESTMDNTGLIYFKSLFGVGPESGETFILNELNMLKNGNETGLITLIYLISYVASVFGAGLLFIMTILHLLRVRLILLFKLISILFIFAVIINFILNFFFIPLYAENSLTLVATTSVFTYCMLGVSVFYAILMSISFND